jgi:hypothetical protein
MVLVTAVSGLAQDPTGRPKESPPANTPNPLSTNKPATARPKKSGRPATPPPATVRLTILTEPPDSAVLINGNKRGVTNAEGKIEFAKLALGQYKVEVRKEGFVSASKIFNAGPDSPTLVFKLQPESQEPVKKVEPAAVTENLSKTDSSPASGTEKKQPEKANTKDSSKGKKGKNKNKSSAAPDNTGTPTLWAAQSEIADLDLYWGIGSQEDAPKPPFTFEKEDLTGTNPKIKVLDANGSKWNVKFDEEVRAEVAASRIVWACGYMVEESYLIPSGKVEGVGQLGRAKKFVGADGSFTNAMFEKRPDTIARRNIRWAWTENPFVGTKELSGLAILNALLNNWDAKIDNNNVLGMYTDDKNTVNDWYIQSDWGGTFGKTGGVFSHSKWDLKEFTKQAFISNVSGGKVNLHYSGKMSSDLKAVPMDHARWFAGILGQLTDKQLSEAFRAANASDVEVKGFVSRIRQKINELKSVAGR